MKTFQVTHDVFPIRGSFTIARGTRTESHVVTVTVTEGRHVGRGEATPYPRYDETIEGVMANITAQRAAYEAGDLDRTALQAAMPGGAARNAIDCALWDLEAKKAGRSVAELLGLTLNPVTTAFTISLGAPDTMANATKDAAHRPLLKVKLGGADTSDPERIAAVRANAPQATLIVDANEGWSPDTLATNMAACAEAGVALIEQPLPASNDAALRDLPKTVTLCADESVHTRDGLAALTDRYHAINVKLDKAGGLTEALELIKAARALDLQVMLGCMIGSSLAMAPAFHAAQTADFVDIDAPLFLAADRDPPMEFEGSVVRPPTSLLWG